MSRLVHSSIHQSIPSMDLPSRWCLLGLGIAFAWAMLGATRRDTTKGKLHLEATGKTGVIHVCKWRDICVWNCVCTYVCAYCVCAQSTNSDLHTYIAWLRLPKETKHWRVCRATSS